MFTQKLDNLKLSLAHTKKEQSRHWNHWGWKMTMYTTKRVKHQFKSHESKYLVRDLKQAKLRMKRLWKKKKCGTYFEMRQMKFWAIASGYYLSCTHLYCVIGSPSSLLWLNLGIFSESRSPSPLECRWEKTTKAASVAGWRAWWKHLCFNHD